MSLSISFTHIDDMDCILYQKFMTLPPPAAFSPALRQKIQQLKALRAPLKLGSIAFDQNLLLAPMASICSAPFRLLMQDLGSGGSVSELISAHGILYKNQKTLDMLTIDAREKNIGIQLFGENPELVSEAATVIQDQGAKFIDINMGCPVRKVVSKGGGSALLKDLKNLEHYIKVVKKHLRIPLTIKIRTGWDQASINAHEVIQLAKDQGVEFVAIHGRTRSQGYSGLSDWDYLESLAKSAPLPLVGNGDLHSPPQVRKRLLETSCDALMIARGALRNPFIFLESLVGDERENPFSGQDYWQVIERLSFYMQQHTRREEALVIHLRKMIVWFAAGLRGVAKFRQGLFSTRNYFEVMNKTQDFFMHQGYCHKKINYEQAFMGGGHG